VFPKVRVRCALAIVRGGLRWWKWVRGSQWLFTPERRTAFTVAFDTVSPALTNTNQADT